MFIAVVVPRLRPLAAPIGRAFVLALVTAGIMLLTVSIPRNAASASLSQSAVAGPPASQTLPTRYLPAGPIAGLTSLLPVLPEPTFEFFTQLSTPTGTIVRRTTGTLEVPTPIDVNGDGIPDITGTLRVISLSNIQLRFDRAPGATQDFPMTVEALVDDPTENDPLPGTLPRDRINFGFDATKSRTPNSWVSTLSISQNSPVTSVDVTTTFTGAGSTIATIGGLFNGLDTARTDPIGGTVAYTPVPSQATLGLTVGGTSTQVRAGASAPVNVHGTAQIVSGTNQKLITADIASIPQQVSVTHDLSNKVRTLTYSASAIVPSANATYTDITGSQINSKAVANLTALPLGLQVQENDNTSHATVTTSGGSLGSGEIGIANGEPAMLAETTPYLRVRRVGGLLSFAARVNNFMSATEDTPGDVTADLQLAPGTRDKVHTLVELADPTFGLTKVDGHVANLPRHLRVFYSPSQGVVTYNAFGETLDNADVTIDTQNILFGQVKHIYGLVKTIPPSLTVTFKPAGGQDGGSFTTDSSTGVGSIEAALTDGVTTYQPLPTGTSGAILYDVPSGYNLPSGFSLWARLSNVKGGSVTRTPKQVVPAQLHAELHTTASQPVSLAATVVDAGSGEQVAEKITGSISALPTDVSIDQTATTISYSASDRISELDVSRLLTANQPAGAPSLDGGVHELTATIMGVPQSFAIVNDGTNQGLENATGGIDSVVLHMWDHGSGQPPLDSTLHNIASVNTRDGRLDIQAEVDHLTNAVISNVLGIEQVQTAFSTAPTSLDFEYYFGTDVAPTDGSCTPTASDPCTDPGLLSTTVKPGPNLTAIPASITLQFVIGKGVHVVWTASDAAEVDINNLETKQFSIEPFSKFSALVNSGMVITLPTSAEICIAKESFCSPKYLSGAFRPLAYNLVAYTVANGPVDVEAAWMCLGDGTDRIYSNCPNGNFKQIYLANVVMDSMRLQFADGMPTCTQPCAPPPPTYLQLYLDTDAAGLSIGNLIYYPPHDTSTELVANLIYNIGNQPFYGVAAQSDLGADDKYKSGSLHCDGVSVHQQHLGGAIGNVTFAVIPDDWGCGG